MRLILLLGILLSGNILMAQCVSGDCVNGAGIYKFKSAAQYMGEFKGGEIHGYGTCYYKNGTTYTGNWAHRYPKGEGTLKIKGKKWIKGVWDRGYLIKNGKQIINDNIDHFLELLSVNIQSGCIKGNCETGEGVFAYANGEKYAGEFKGGKPNGQGAMTYANDEKYIGGFKESLPEGEGKIIQEDGTTVVEATWEKGDIYRAPKVDRNIVFRDCRGGNCHNVKGTYFYNEAKYVGEFKKGIPSGYGTVYFFNGEKYVGYFSNNMANGEGTFTNVKGQSITGIWRDFDYVGPIKKKAKVVENAPPPPKKYPRKSKPATNKSRQNVYVVIVGVASYGHMPTLRYTDDDAYRINAFFRSPEGGAIPKENINVLIDESATREKILLSMNTMFRKADSNDLVILYFSGHGLKGAFLPIDYDGYNNRIMHSEISAIFAKSKAKHKICIADACHSGSLLQARGSSPQTIATYYDQLAKSKGGTALILSSKSKETSLESSGLRQGVFSHFLIRGMEGEGDLNRNGVVEVQELYNYISKNVTEYTGKRQSPIIKGTYDARMPISVVR